MAEQNQDDPKGSVFVGWGNKTPSKDSTDSANKNEDENTNAPPETSNEQQSSSDTALKNSVFVGFPKSGGTGNKGSVFVGLGASNSGDSGGGPAKSGESAYEAQAQPQNDSAPSPSSEGAVVSDQAKSAFVMKDDGTSAPALKSSVFVNLGPQSSTAVAGESVKVPLKNVSSDPGTIGKVQRLKSSKPQAVLTVKTPSEESEKSKGAQSSALLDWAGNRVDESKRLASDMSNITDHEIVYKIVIEIYMWVAACLAVHFAFGLFSTYVLQRFIGKALGNVLTIIFLPAGTLYFFRNSDMTRGERKLNLLFTTGLFGLFIGLISKDPYTTFHAPAPFIVALSIGCCAWVMGHSYTKQSRETILAMSIGPGMMVYFMYGVLNKCMDLIYLIWMIIVGTVAVVDLQMKLGTIYDSQRFVFYEQVQSIIAFVVADLLVTAILAFPDEDED